MCEEMYITDTGSVEKIYKQKSSVNLTNLKKRLNGSLREQRVAPAVAAAD
jgi:hypothetical protein